MTTPFRTLTAAVLLCLTMLPAAALGTDGCGARDVRAITASVPNLTKEMSAAADATTREQTLANDDDARIAATVRLRPNPVEARVTRADYVRDVQRSLDAASTAGGGAVETSLNPYDPVSWSLARHGVGVDSVSTGEEVVRLSPTCRFVIDWQAPNVPVLQQRVQRFGAAVRALRDAAAPQAEASTFAGDDYVPTGLAAICLGLALPLAVVALVTHLVLRLAEDREPPRASRACALAAGAAAAVAVALQSRSFLANLADLRFSGEAALLVLVCALAAIAATLGWKSLVGVALSAAMTCGYSLGVATYLNWVPSWAVSLGCAIPMALAGGYGLWTWIGPYGSAVRRDVPPGPPQRSAEAQA